MENNPVQAIPEGYPSVIPYLLVQGVGKLLDFLQRAFDANVISGVKSAEGSFSHVDVRIGDSVVMLAEARDDWRPIPTMLYFYVPDTDATYRRALQAGAISLMEPANQFYGDRNAGIQDPGGNSWWIATHVEDVSPEEIQRRDEARRK